MNNPQQLSAKFQRGQKVIANGKTCVVDGVHFDISDGWEYHLRGDEIWRWTFEEDLKEKP